MVRAQHVEFVIQTVFDISIIASELAEVGVKEVSITVDTFCDLKLDLGLICELVRAGISKITIEAEFGASDWEQKRDYFQLMEELSESGTCTDICIRSRRLPDYNDGQTCTSSGRKCTYVSRVKRDCSKDVHGKDELLISTL
ncbi:hypothetical protein PRIPAC_95934 [Pristionchus pacificus]|uniref:Uncharacterized protein n=1 Tax=Pristionchus pacificus TaxID=54126 RepID=A0A2A6D203_PRIPA|nr:hypothetical protein PRIPAC_95934 [Pristionchus pacificus]|eukprot:PDM84337.1 hypothetical protein PRIPAC_33360 [Pristionchus pacificus]